MLTVQNVYDFINERAPFDLQESFDNAGILVGHPDQEVHGIHVAMDVTGRVIDEAEAHGANLIITHHPMMFSARRRLVETDSETRLLCRLIRSNISLIAAHTNLDRAPGGINDVLAQLCGLTEITPTECGCERHIGLFRQLGRWEEDDNAVPLPGDLIFYDWDMKKPGDATGWSDHVGIVVGTKWPFVKVIEGNKDDSVSYRILLLGDWQIRGYAKPDYAGTALSPRAEK